MKPDTNETDNNSSHNPFVSKTWSSPVTLSSLAIDAGDPVVAVDESGNIIAAWVEKGEMFSIHASFMNGESNEWQPSLQIDNQSGDSRVYGWRFFGYSRPNPQLAFANNKGFLTWIQHDGNSYAVNVSRWDGIQWGSPEVISSEQAGNAFYPRIVIDSEGNTTVAWVQERGNGQSALVMSNHYNEESGTWSEAEAISLTESVLDKSGSLQLSLNDLELPTVTWVAQLNENTEAVYYSIWQDNQWTAEQKVAEGEFDDLSLAHTSVTDKPVIAWSRKAESNQLFVEVARQTNEGWQIDNLTTQFKYDADAPNIVSGPKDEISIVWSQNSAGQNGWIYLDAYAMHYTPEKGWHNLKNLYGSGGTLPQVKSDKNGNLLAIWHAENTYSRTYTNEQGWSSFSRPFDFNGGRGHVLDMNDEGQAAAIWTQYGSTEKVYISILK